MKKKYCHDRICKYAIAYILVASGIETGPRKRKNNQDGTFTEDENTKTLYLTTI